MFPSPRTLIIPLGGDELTVSVEGTDALLDLGPGGRVRAPEPDEVRDEPPDVPPDVAADQPRAVMRLRVPARALVAAVRVAWADEHDRGRFEPWRGDGGPPFRRAHGRYGYGYGYDAGYDRYDEAFEDGDARYGHAEAQWDDDLGDGDPEGYRDPAVVPFRLPSPPARPSRAGQPWERDEEDELRRRWLAADPEADRAALTREIAEALERPVGGLFVRLQVVGCDPTRPGRRRFEVDDEADEAELENQPVPLDGSG